MHKSKHEKNTRWGLWMAALAGLGCGALLGNAPAVLAAAPTCYEKVECAQLPVSSLVCGEVCSKRANCGSLVVDVGLGFYVQEASSNGYEDVSAWDSDPCYLLQKCKSDFITACPNPPTSGNWFVCEVDSDPVWCGPTLKDGLRMRVRR